MCHRVLILAIVFCTLLVAALLVALSFLGIEWGAGSRPLAESLPQWADGAPDDLSEYRSSVKGYTIHFPKDWTQNPTNIDVGQTSTDVFYALSAGGEAGVAPTLSVTNESLPPGTTAKDYMTFYLGFLDSAKTEVSEPQSVEIDGVRGYLIDYKGYSHKYPVEVTTVVLVKGEQGWELTLAVPDGQRTQFRPLLAAVLHSLTIP